MIEILTVLAFIWLIFAIVQDFKYREIANWLNFSLAIFAMAARLFYSIFLNNYDYFFFGIFGLAVFFIVGHLFYYVRIFAGGDAKLLIAFGAVVPFANTFYENSLIMMLFIFALLFLGAFYSLIYSLILSYLNYKKFTKEFARQVRINEKYFYLAVFFGVVLSVIVLFSGETAFFAFPLLILLFPLLLVYAKAVETSCMIKYVDAKSLTIGDWLVDPLKIKNKVIKPNWEGIDEKQVKFIKKYYKKKVLVKYGVPFSPSFILAFIFLLIIKYYMNSNWGFLGLW